MHVPVHVLLVRVHVYVCIVPLGTTKLQSIGPTCTCTCSGGSMRAVAKARREARARCIRFPPFYLPPSIFLLFSVHVHVHITNQQKNAASR